MSRPKDHYPNQRRRYPDDLEPAKVAERPALPLLSASQLFDAKLSQLAPSRAPVLLVGASARSKADAALALHERSGRAAGPFIFVDCAALHGTAEEVLFGGPAYAAATGGAALAAQRGTLYVASVEALPLFVQPRLLRLLDESVTVRVVASTLVDLKAQVEAGAFRWDLAERLSLVELRLPEEA